MPDGGYRIPERCSSDAVVYGAGAAAAQKDLFIRTLTGSSSTIELVPYAEAYAPGFEDMRRRVPSLEKIGGLIGYQPRYTLEDTLRRVIEYEKNSLEAGKE